MNTAGPVVMRTRAVSKVYGGTHALTEVDFSIRTGAVTALFGENGAGKSTLMKILAGVETPSSGVIEMDGTPVTFRSAADAVRHGVAIIHQELNLCPNLSVTDNLFLGRERTGRGGLLDSRGQRRITTACWTGWRSRSIRTPWSVTFVWVSSRSSRSRVRSRSTPGF